MPEEIVIKPPPPNATWCFPNTSLRGAAKLQELLRRGRLRPTNQAVQAASQKVAEAVRLANLGDPPYRLWLLQTQGEHYSVLSQGVYELTLATEKGNFYLKPIPERFDRHYDSLVDARLLR